MLVPIIKGIVVINLEMIFGGYNILLFASRLMCGGGN